MRAGALSARAQKVARGAKSAWLRVWHKWAKKSAWRAGGFSVWRAWVAWLVGVVNWARKKRGRFSAWQAGGRKKKQIKY